MATSTLSPATTLRPVIWKRLLCVLLLVLSLAGIFVVGWFYWAAKTSLPQIDGTIHVVGVTSPVQVIRDAQGIPHIRAHSMADLCFAQGYVTAQDRLWQVDIARRYGAGELAEILGEEVVPLDREQRILGMTQAAERGASALQPEERALMQAYARGVNAFIETHRDRLPIEFKVLRYQPRPWQIK